MRWEAADTVVSDLLRKTGEPRNQGLLSCRREGDVQRLLQRGDHDRYVTWRRARRSGRATPPGNYAHHRAPLVATHISAAALLILRIVLVNRGADVTNTFDHNGSAEGLLGRQDNMVTSVVAPCPRAEGGNVLGILILAIRQYTVPSWRSGRPWQGIEISLQRCF